VNFKIHIKETLTKKDKEELLDDIASANQKYLRRFKTRNARQELDNAEKQINEHYKDASLKDKIRLKSTKKLIAKAKSKLMNSSYTTFILSLFKLAPIQKVQFEDNVVNIEIAPYFFLLPLNKMNIKRILKKAMKTNGFTVTKIEEIKESE